MNGLIRTPHLARAVTDYTSVLGFVCRQHIPGVLAVVEHGPLQLHLWACGAPPGRWETPVPGQRPWAPGHHSVVVREIHALYTSIQIAVLKPVRTTLAGARTLYAHRLPSHAPVLQPWGAWEFSFDDVDGQTIHCVDWGAWRPAPDGRLRQRRLLDAPVFRDLLAGSAGDAPNG